MWNRFIIAALAIAMGTQVWAQGTNNDVESDFGTKTSIGIDKKITKGFHVNANYELRTNNNVSDIDSHRAGVGVSYKFNSWLKGDLGYTFIDSRSSLGDWRVRHRGSVALTGTYRYGLWRFSLKEELRFTHKTDAGLNTYQSVRNQVALKSRIKASYKGFRNIEPYAYAEFRLALNDPSVKATWHSDGQYYSDYEFGGYDDVYFNRYRGAIGAEWNINKRNSIDFGLQFDYCRDKDIDTNKAGTTLKSLTYDRTFMTNLKVAYTFSF